MLLKGLTTGLDWKSWAQDTEIAVCGDDAGVAREAAALKRLSLLHVYGDPLKYRDLETKIEVERYNTAIVLCDLAWVDPDQVMFPCPRCRAHHVKTGVVCSIVLRDIQILTEVVPGCRTLQMEYHCAQRMTCSG